MSKIHLFVITAIVLLVLSTLIVFPAQLQQEHEVWVALEEDCSITYVFDSVDVTMAMLDITNLENGDTDITPHWNIQDNGGYFQGNKKLPESYWNTPIFIVLYVFRGSEEVNFHKFIVTAYCNLDVTSPGLKT